MFKMCEFLNVLMCEYLNVLMCECVNVLVFFECVNV